MRCSVAEFAASARRFDLEPAVLGDLRVAHVVLLSSPLKYLYPGLVEDRYELVAGARAAMYTNNVFAAETALNCPREFMSGRRPVRCAVASGKRATETRK
jgi:hypothetical protein